MKIDDIQPLLRQRDVVLLDVRDPHEIEAAGTVKGAIRIPFKDLERRIGDLPRDKRIVTA